MRMQVATDIEDKLHRLVDLGTYNCPHYCCSYQLCPAHMPFVLGVVGKGVHLARGKKQKKTSRPFRVVDGRWSVIIIIIG